MEAVYSSETSVDFHQKIWHYIPEDGKFHGHRCDNLKSDLICTVRCKIQAQQNIVFSSCFFIKADTPDADQLDVAKKRKERTIL
jgi:hypothetical protein